jgi:uncharacterized protein YlxW (UPF0749 family)
MSEPNYNETIVIPLLQNKFKELVNSNLVLEASVLVERAKIQYLNSRIEDLESKLETYNRKKKKDDAKSEGNSF